MRVNICEVYNAQVIFENGWCEDGKEAWRMAGAQQTTKHSESHEHGIKQMQEALVLKVIVSFHFFF